MPRPTAAATAKANRKPISRRTVDDVPKARLRRPEIRPLIAGLPRARQARRNGETPAGRERAPPLPLVGEGARAEAKPSEGGIGVFSKGISRRDPLFRLRGLTSAQPPSPTRGEGKRAGGTACVTSRAAPRIPRSAESSRHHRPIPRRASGTRQA